MQHLIEASDADILAAMFLADEERGECSNAPAVVSAHSLDWEVERRFGEGALDRLSNYCTASHMTHTEMVQAARTETGLMVEIAKDAHSCGDGPNAKLKYNGEIGAPGIGQSWVCQCGHYWVKVGNTMYNPAEGEIPMLTLADVV
jgi:hypothetical protein